MPEDSKTNLDKRKNDPKEQRKPRNSRNQTGKNKRENEKIEESKSTPRVTVPQKPPVYEDPGPEFYKNLKRETEEIVKITEEENSKYKKKEIQSNWSKYEMPIESYEEIEEHDVGADYEKLIQAPLTIGGHFQFKHEKSWDVNTGPSLYDKYFNINMDNLSLAVSTVPFYERNSVEQSLFSETDMLSMNNRATKYKQKYFNDKSYSTPETEAQDKILNSLKESLSKNNNDKADTDCIDNDDPDSLDNTKESSANRDDINLDFKNIQKIDNMSSPIHSIVETKEVKKTLDSTRPQEIVDDDFILETVTESNPVIEEVQIVTPPQEIIENKVDVTVKDTEAYKICDDMPNLATGSRSTEPKTEIKPKDKPVEPKTNPVIESPEDLEKWLDDFLDG